MPESKEEKPTEEKNTDSGLNLDLEEMAKAGLHFGHRTSNVHPKMAPYIFGVRNTVHIINLEKTKERLDAALDFLRGLAAENKILLFVGTKVQAKKIVKETALECQMPYVIERWLGGSFTNFEVFRKRVEYFKELESKRASGELEKYTKKERAEFDKEIKDLEAKFGGVKNLDRLPDAVFVADMKKDFLAVKEARAKGVKIVGISDTNIDPSLADYPIPANDDAISSLNYILGKIKEVILEMKSKAQMPNQIQSPNDKVS